jgi:hypothetical protein
VCWSGEHSGIAAISIILLVIYGSLSSAETSVLLFSNVFMFVDSSSGLGFPILCFFILRKHLSIYKQQVTPLSSSLNHSSAAALEMTVVSNNNPELTTTNNPNAVVSLAVEPSEHKEKATISVASLVAADDDDIKDISRQALSTSQVCLFSFHEIVFCLSSPLFPIRSRICRSWIILAS